MFQIFLLVIIVLISFLTFSGFIEKFITNLMLKRSRFFSKFPYFFGIMQNLVWLLFVRQSFTVNKRY